MGSMETSDGVHTYIWVFKSGTAKIKEKCKRKRYVWIDLYAPYMQEKIYFTVTIQFFESGRKRKVIY